MTATPTDDSSAAGRTQSGTSGVEGVLLFALAAGIAGFLAAPWLGRVPQKSAYIFLSLGLLAGTAACGFEGNDPLLLVARCVTGGFGGVLGGLALAMRNVPPFHCLGHIGVHVPRTALRRFALPRAVLSCPCGA